ncbi:hypothetical protein ABIA69_001851 [Lysinibacillus parviboronicapiens]|uniref:Hemolytic protein HlpA-like protein n=1 Tax=Lysinibacillus parviboronicapiens TaxID=436516 RepID=A0ABV2PID9_9BACI
MKKPVAFIIFNRPDTTAIVFEEIRKYAPEQLFVIADGPRVYKNGEVQLCLETREVIQVNWDCDVTYIYSEENLGCQKRISSGLDEVFSYVEDAIILEDDCVPHEDFFVFCENLLDYYKNYEGIMAISGDNFQDNNFEIEESYYFSIFPHCWGWATWRRAWSKMDIEMKEWNAVKENNLFKEYWFDIYFEKYWTNIYDRVSNGEIDSWAYPWTFSCWYYRGKTILPKKNLVSNIGFGENATHTNSENKLLGNLPVHKMDFPLKHPTCLKTNFEADFYTSEKVYYVDTLKEHAMTNSMKIQLFKYLMDLRNLEDLFKNEVYIFGTGELGKMINSFFKANGYQIEKFIVSEPSEYNQNFDGVEVVEPTNLSEKKMKIIVSIEGKHDKEIIVKLKRIFKEDMVEIFSWKDLILS